MIDWDTSQSLVARDRNRLRQVHQKKKDVELLMTTVRGLRISPFLKLDPSSQGYSFSSSHVWM